MSHPPRTGVFFIHGLTGSPAEMAPLDKALRRAGYQTVVPLIAGHGAGHRELLATTWQDWHEGLRRDLREFARTYDEVVIVGLCVGGLLGLLLAGEEKVRGAVALSPDLGLRVRGPATPWNRCLLPLAYRVPWLRRHGYWTQKPPYGIKNPRLQQRIAKAVAASIHGQTAEYGTFRTYVGTMLELKRLQRVVVQALPRVDCPALVIHSVEDSMFSIRNATVMYHALGSIRKELALITGCDHVITVDLRKDDVARRVIRFVAGGRGVSAESEAEDEFLACEIVPNRTEVGQSTEDGQSGDALPPALNQRASHRLIVRKGSVGRLMLTVREDAERSADVLDARYMSSDPHGRPSDTLTAEWQLAAAAIDALSYGVQKRWVIEEKMEQHAASASRIEPVAAHTEPDRAPSPSLIPTTL